MNTLGDYIEDLKEYEMMSIEGGKFLEQDFGYDLGYALGWLLSAMGKGASAIHG